MSNFSFFVAAVMLAVVGVLASSTGGAAAIDGIAIPPKPHMARSIIQACRRDANAICKNDSNFKCWSAKLFDAAEAPKGIDAVCAKWIADRKACLSDADKFGCKVNATAPQRVQEMSRRRCWRDMPDDQVSKECLGSDFFKSSRMARRRVSKPPVAKAAEKK